MTLVFHLQGSKWSISAHLGLFPACPYDRSQNPCHLPALRTRFPARPGVGDSLPSQNAPAAILESVHGLPKQNLRFSPRCLTDLASIARDGDVVIEAAFGRAAR